MIKSLIGKIPCINRVWTFINKRKFEKLEIESWEKRGEQVPPPHIVKFITIKQKRIINKAKVLIETGTYEGAMIDSCKRIFKKIYSIELDESLCENARILFQSYPHITIINGDSGEKLVSVLKEINEPCLFWLDGHYSGGITAKGNVNTPIMAELKAILTHHINNHVILIDDARLFVGENDYPTVNDLTTFVQNENASKRIVIENDIIIIW